MVYKRTAWLLQPYVVCEIYLSSLLFLGSYLGLFGVSIFAFRLPQRVAIDQEQEAICKDDRYCIMLAILYCKMDPRSLAQTLLTSASGEVPIAASSSDLTCARGLGTNLGTESSR